MPARQSGQKIREKKSGRYGFRYYDENGDRRYKGGFETRSEREEELRRTLDALEAPDLRPDMTVQELVDEFLEQYDREPGSVATLTANLKHVTAKFATSRSTACPSPS